jgi:5-oxoprolinase (ATP-hydrolysing) subunit C
MMAKSGDTVVLAPPIHFFGRFIYVAVEGGIDVPLVLGSRSTYLPGAFGGYKGRMLRAGDELPLGRSRAASSEMPVSAAFDGDAIRVVFGPRRAMFTAEHRLQFLSTEFKVAQASDRMGYRLDGPPLAGGEWGTRLSEPVCPGAIQITASGQPIVLMPDAPTVGGYPVIGVVHSADLGRLAQKLPGEAVRFVEVSIAPTRGS